MPPDLDLSPVGRGVRYQGEGTRFRFLAGVRNINREDNDWAEPVPPEPAPRTSAKWKATGVRILKYVDDGVQIEKLNTETAVRYELHGRDHQVKHAVKTQNAFSYVTARAESVGMKVNNQKTSLLCVSDAQSFVAEAYIMDGQTRIPSGTGAKLLGFHFSQRPTVTCHLGVLRRRFRSRYWVLRHLRSVGFNEQELVKVYKVIVRPVADYLAVVYHSMMTDEQDEMVERLQAQALKCIYGWNYSYAALRKMARVETLRHRRLEMVDKFAAKCAGSARFGRWLPERQRRREASRCIDKYQEFFARCERLRSSPLHYMRRRLNGKEGKMIGERNKEYRQTDGDGIALKTGPALEWRRGRGPGDVGVG